MTMGNKMTVMEKSSISTLSFNKHLLHTQDGTSLVTKTVLRSYQPGRGEEKYASNDNIKLYQATDISSKLCGSPVEGMKNSSLKQERPADQEVAGNGQVAPRLLFLKGNYAFISSL